MSGEYDDLLAAFNIPSADGQKQKTTTTDDKPPLMSPKKLALNEKASTTDLPEVDSDDDDGWIIDETAPGDAKKESAPAADKLQNGQAEKNLSSHPKTQEGEIQNRRKQVFPKVTPQLSPPGSIATSYTPIQGWKGTTTNVPLTNPQGPQSGYLKQFLTNVTIPPISSMSKEPGSSLQQYLMNPSINTAPNAPGIPQARHPPPTTRGVIPPIGTFTQGYKSRSRSPGASIPAAGARMQSPGSEMQSHGAILNVPRTSMPLPVHTVTNNISGAGPTRGPTVLGGLPSTSRSPVEKIVIPVIDQTSVVSERMIASTPKLILAKPPPQENPLATGGKWTLSNQSAKKLVDPSQKVAKVYKPTVPRSKYKDYDAPEGGYQCKACSCTFLSESSILDHVKRPSFIMMFVCELCPGQKTHKFYNRCALWLHLLSHSQNAIKNFERLVQSMEVEPFTREEFLSYDFGATCTKGLSDFLQSGATASVDPEGLKCPGCMGQVQEADGIVAHLGRIDKLLMAECQTCRRLLRNNCERQLHRLMHKKKSVCPGCGAQHASEKDYFKHCTGRKCLYWLSVPLFVCSLCLQPHYSLDEFSRHLCEHHNISYFKCILCQLAFRGANTLYDHHRKEHRFTPLPKGITNLQKILKCPLCKNVFTGSSALQTHITDSHLDDMVSSVHKYVYRCPRCPGTSRNFFDKNGLLNHVNHAHGMATAPILCDLCGMHLYSTKALHDHRHGCYKFVKRRKEEKRKVNSPGQITTETKRVLRCSQCPQSSRVFYSTQLSFNTHCRVSHPGLTPYPVWVELVTTKNKTTISPLDPSKKDKRPKSPKPRRIEPAPTVLSKTAPSPAASADGDGFVPATGQTTSGQPTTTSKNDSSNNQTNKRPSTEETEHARKKVKSDHAENGIAPVEAEEKEVVKEILKRRRNCAKCEFTSEEWEVFQEHIKTHKTNPSHQQCQECGVCFRSNMAVTRHMAMMHRIQTPVEPAAMPLSTPAGATPKVTPREEPSPPPKAAAPPPARPTIKEEPPTLECTVCYRKYTTDTLLRNHMRTHGMAFIRSKRRSRDHP